MPRTLTSTEKYQLIEEVKKLEYIWSKKDDNYSDRDLKERAFQEIGENFEAKYTAAEIRTAWNSLRNSFTRELDQKPSGSEAGKKPKWEFFNSLLFLKENVKKRKTASNVPLSASSNSEVQGPVANETGGDTDDTTPEGALYMANPEDQPQVQAKGPENSSTSKSGSRVKRKAAELDEVDQYLLEQIKQSKEERDPDMLFGASVGASLKKLTEATKIRTKMQIQNLLGQAELNDLDMRMAASPPIIIGASSLANPVAEQGVSYLADGHPSYSGTITTSANGTTFTHL